MGQPSRPQAVRLRQAEDRRACLKMGAEPVYLDIPDCIYRTARNTGAHLYASEESLFGPLHPAERRLVERLSRRLARNLPPEAQIVAPLSLGNHVDHQLTRLAAEQTGRALAYYADYPYAEQSGCRAGSAPPIGLAVSDLAGLSPGFTGLD